MASTPGWLPSPRGGPALTGAGPTGDRGENFDTLLGPDQGSELDPEGLDEGCTLACGQDARGGAGVQRQRATDGRC